MAMAAIAVPLSCSELSSSASVAAFRRRRNAVVVRVQRCSRIKAVEVEAAESSSSSSSSSSPPDALTLLVIQYGVQRLSKLVESEGTLCPNLIGAVIKRLRNPELAFQLFLWSETQKDYKHTAHTYNSIITSLFIGRKRGSDFIRDTYSLLRRMKSQGIAPDASTYNIIVKGLVRAGDLDGGVELLREMISKNHSPELVTTGMLVQWFCLRGRVCDVCELFEGMKNQQKDAINIGALAYCSILRALLSIGKWEDALNLCKKIVEDGSFPAVLAYRTMLDGLIRAEKMEEASIVVTEMINYNVDDDSETYTSLVTALCRYGRTEDAMRVFQLMRQKDLIANVDAYSSLIVAHCRQDELDMAYEIFLEMVQRGYGPNASTYTLFFKSLCSSGRGKAQLAYEVHKAMQIKGYGYSPDGAPLYVGLVSELCREGRLEEASEVYIEMCEATGFRHVYGFGADVYELMIQELCRKGKVDLAMEWTGDIVRKGYIPTIETYNTLLNGLLNVGDCEGGVRMLHAMEKNGFVGDELMLAYNMCIHGLCNAKMMDDALILLSDGLEKKIIFHPVNVICNSLVKGLFSVDRHHDALLLIKEMYKNGYDVDEELISAAVAEDEQKRKKKPKKRKEKGI